jgi:hypothetical protein
MQGINVTTTSTATTQPNESIITSEWYRTTASTPASTHSGAQEVATATGTELIVALIFHSLLSMLFY